MSELLRVTQPIINRNQMVNPQGKPTPESTIPFQILDSAKVQSMATSKETQEQNATILLRDNEQPTILMDMLQDPQATVQFLRTIYLLQEVVNMMPLVDNPLSEEIQELFQSLLLKPEDIMQELVKQEDSSSIFRGELFDNLRNVLNEMAKMDLVNATGGNTNALDSANALVNNLVSTINGEVPLEFDVYNANGPLATQIKADIIVLLKSINQVVSREDILTSIGNNLTFLSNALKASKGLSEQLKNLSEWFKYPNEDFDFSKAKGMVLDLIKQVESSILFTPKIEKNVSILQYNLSRYSNDDNLVKDAIQNMFKYFPLEKEQLKFEQMVFDYIKNMTSFEGKLSSSKVMNTLTTLIEKQLESNTLLNLDPAKIEKIIYSLLASPSNFTPLLHYVIPVEYMDFKTFAEVWIDPVLDEEEEQSKGNEAGERSMKVLVAFDVEVLGRFESEILVDKNRLTANIYVPKDFYEAFKNIKDNIMRGIVNSTYELEDVNILPLQKPRSLMEVFDKLPIKRSGINVKV